MRSLTDVRVIFSGSVSSPDHMIKLGFKKFFYQKLLDLSYDVVSGSEISPQIKSVLHI